MKLSPRCPGVLLYVITALAQRGEPAAGTAGSIAVAIERPAGQK